MVINDYLNFATTSVILNKLQEGYYLDTKYNQSNARSIVKEARKLLKEDYDDFIKDAKEQLLNQALDLATESRSIGNLQNALACMKFASDLLGLNKQNINVSGELNENVNITFTSARKEEEDDS